MKLRDRQECVLHNIKQDDIKLAVDVAKLSTSTEITDSAMDDFDIKQEETKDHTALVQQHGEFGKKDYYYHCDMCNKKMADLKSVLEHCHSVHSIKRTSGIKNMDTDPDVHNLNCYCKSCDTDYKNTGAYRGHLRNVHYMVLKPISRWKTPRSDTFPDPDDPNFRCTACEHTYTLKSSYLRHCRYAQGVRSGKLAYQRYTPPSSVVDTYCQTCDKRLSVDQRPELQKPKDVMPNVNDPNFYCRSCERKLVNKDSFKLHLAAIHSLYPSSPEKSKIKPDASDPNNYCSVCQKTSQSKGRYRKHLRLVHQMTLPSLRVRDIQKGCLPDPNNPHNYCNVYNWFLSNSNATIDINNPQFYCAQSNRSYCRKQYFRKHIRSVHGIEFVSK
ncbi:hypothetical protein MAM1_0014d01397 [Mucor ambiguus]|uniref:C2H2-type domain-containing protein n=1 Tax=Mucor ambiguus TaxID=91626 RepID=A0A0C9LR53_9FUNG|nr:hypothetical protein MAM1_0014d01397 [Mucor ambiguus]